MASRETSSLSSRLSMLDTLWNPNLGRGAAQRERASDGGAKYLQNIETDASNRCAVDGRVRGRDTGRRGGGRERRSNSRSRLRAAFQSRILLPEARLIHTFRQFKHRVIDLIQTTRRLPCNRVRNGPTAETPLAIPHRSDCPGATAFCASSNSICIAFGESPLHL